MTGIKEEQVDIHLQARERGLEKILPPSLIQPTLPQLDLRIPASRTTGQQISVVQVTWFVVLCYKVPYTNIAGSRNGTRER